MTKFALKGLLGRKLRTALTALAIVLGVAMISGTYVLTDSIDSAFDTIFTDVRKGSDVVVTGKSAFDLSDGSGATAPAFDESLLETVRDVETKLSADEPTGNLDSATGSEILTLMRDSVDSYGQTTVMVTHEARAAAIADRILFLADGLIVRDLPAASQAEILETLNELAAA